MDAIELRGQSVETGHADEIHLFTDAQEGAAASPVVAIRWCICSSILEKLWAGPKSARNPYVLLVVSQEGREVGRKFVPLEQEMEYFYFQRPGLHRIQATILSHKDAGAVRRCLLAKSRMGDYNTSVLDWNGVFHDFRREWGGDYFQIGKGEISVDVASGFFAKKPARWLWWWVNLWYETDPRDQCQFRRRCMLAFSLQPFVVLAWIIFIFAFRFFAALFLRFGCGIRGVDFGPSCHPFQNETEDVWDNQRGSIFLSDKWERRRPWFLALLMPVIAIPLLAAICSIDYFLFFKWSVWQVLEVFAMAPVGFALLFALCYVLLRLLGLAARFRPAEEDQLKRAQNMLEQKARREEAENTAAVQRYEDTYSPLVCQGVPLEANLRALPWRRRTFYLQFMNFKRRVCMPFAK